MCMREYDWSLKVMAGGNICNTSPDFNEPEKQVGGKNLIAPRTIYG